MNKTNTDLFWNNRFQDQKDPRKVNIDDLVQRELEAEFIKKHIKKTDKILEVGCGNGFFTSFLREIADHVDAFDYAENMIEQAKSIYHEKNNHFFHDNLLAPQHVTDQYDCVVCVRVLINLQNIDEQKTALKNLFSWVKPGGKLVLLEGFIEGFNALNTIRSNAGIDKMSPAAINFYSEKSVFETFFPPEIKVLDTFNTGMFDFLTRVIYPALVGPNNATEQGEFHEKIKNVSASYNPSCLEKLARLHGWALEKAV